MLLAASPAAAGPDLLRLRVTDLRPVLAWLSAEGFDIAGVDRVEGTIDVVADAEGRVRLEALGFAPAVVPVPEADDRYLDPGEVDRALAAAEARFPDLARRQLLGFTEEGRPYWALKLSANVMVEEDEPAVLFVSQHHAREVMTPEVAADIIQILLRSYGRRDDVTRLLDSAEIWVVPSHNPDGTNHVFTVADLWRKNRRNNGDGSRGVDPNRNYPYRWGGCGGSSGWTSSETYRGPFAASEPETAALMALALEQRPVLAVTYHSYGELVIYPYGCSGSRPPDRLALEQFGAEVAGRLVRDSGTGTYLPGYGWEILYPVDGELTDWLYAALGTFGLTVEMNASAQGFQPAYESWRSSTVRRQRAGWAAVLRRLDGPGVRGHVRDAVSGAPLEAEVAVAEVPLSPAEAPRTSDPQWGRYQRLLLPGNYRVRFAAPGYLPREVPVTVEETALDLDVDLTPETEG